MFNTAGAGFMACLNGEPSLSSVDMDLVYGSAPDSPKPGPGLRRILILPGSYAYPLPSPAVPAARLVDILLL